MMIYVNGCSHTIGVNGKYSWSYVLGKSISRKIYYTVGNNQKKYFEEVDYITNQNTLYNFSDSAKGNDMIFYETIEFLSKCKLNNIKPNYVFIQWSGPSRLARQDIFGNIVFNTPGDEEKPNIIFEPHASRTSLSYIFSLQEILKSMDIDYYFCCYMDFDKDCQKYPMFHSIDLERFISFDNTSHPILDGFRNMMRKKYLALDAAGHPSYLGHYFIANKFLKKINVEIAGFFEVLPPLNEVYPRNIIKKPFDFIDYYDDNMINKRDMKKLVNDLQLKEGSESEKNNIRKSIF